MTDRDALLAAIAANPDDDTPRLVFADWLEENGEPHWAGFIRAECGLHRLLDGWAPGAAAYRHLDGRPDDPLAAVRWADINPDIARLADLRAAARKLRRKCSPIRAAGLPSRCGVRWLGE